VSPNPLSQELKEKLAKYRLNETEYGLICEQLKRPPQGVEWALYSALWSEHCSYKSSRIHLKNLFRDGPRVQQAFGENAGVIDLGEGERVAFKIESHNHPSFIEPYQGAATGVGGILRDIFTMGARPVALANYLCFGDPKANRMPALVDGVVRGIGGYGNCVGVATLTGQTECHSSYNENILVNAMAVGLFRPGEKIHLSKASGPGNHIVYVGAKTGRDGIHGASMASESFAEGSEKKRPTVQIGDPFYEKLLIEACLEVMEQDLVVAIQDMGAAGLTSSSFEMAAKGGVGFDLHLDRVPLRDSSMEPEDILLSESQERMLLIAEPSKLKAIQAVFARWDLDAVSIGLVTPPAASGSVVRLFWHGEVLTTIDPGLLTDHAPAYERPFDKWQSRIQRSAVPDSAHADEVVLALPQVLGSGLGVNRRFIYEQYDQRVGAATVWGCDQPIGVHRLKDSERYLGIVLGCRPTLMRQDAWVGGFDAIYEPALQLSLRGFEPLAVTDCLNFGNPENRAVMSEFVASLDGLNTAAKLLETPIISGNVSFYNESRAGVEKRNITSTPSTGLVGLRAAGNLPQTIFDGSTLDLYLLEAPWLVTKAFWSESLGGNTAGKDAQALSTAAGVTGLAFGKSETYECSALNLATLAGFQSTLRKDALAGVFSAARVVGKFGPLGALVRMMPFAGKPAASVVAGDFGQWDQDPLYAVLVGVRRGVSWDKKAYPRVRMIGEVRSASENRLEFSSSGVVSAAWDHKQISQMQDRGVEHVFDL
jgi:phosphoribosylformylglycinamidine synthase II